MLDHDLKNFNEISISFQLIVLLHLKNLRVSKDFDRHTIRYPSMFNSFSLSLNLRISIYFQLLFLLKSKDFNLDQVTFIFFLYNPKKSQENHNFQVMSIYSHRQNYGKKKRFNLQAPPVYDRKVTNLFFFHNYFFHNYYFFP